MAKKDKTLLWILLIGGGAGLYWYFSKKAAAAAPAPATATATPSLPAPPVTAVLPPPSATLTTTATPPPLITAAAAPTPGTTLQPSGVPYDTRMDTLQTWANTSLNACDLGRWNSKKGSFTQDEWNGLFDIYFNDWQAGGGTTAARTQFWNNWRIKYQILTNTPC